MAQGFIGASGCMAYLGAFKMREGYIGAARVYSAGNIVTYKVGVNTYQEEVDEGSSCLSPKTFTPALSGWTFVGWRQDTAANGSVLSNLTMGNEPITLYAVFSQIVTVTYYNDSTSARKWSKERYYNTNNISNPTFALTQNAISGWITRGWSTDTAANGSITYANGASFARDSNITLYGMYQQTITVSYSGNGATGGSTAAQTGTRYYNPGSGAVLNPSFSLQTNGFTRSGYTFSKWALGSAGGTQYAAGASITLAANSTMHAVWVYAGAPFYIVKGYACYYTLGWTLVSTTNATGLRVSNFVNGNPAYTSIGSGTNNDAQPSSFTAVSDSIPTRGNKTIRLSANISSAGGSISINGVSKTLSGTFSETFDISNVSSIKITATGSSWGQTSDPYIQFIEIYLY